MKSKLIEILSTFSAEEMKRFGQFLSSPYFHSGRNLNPLYKVLRKSNREFKSDKISEEKIFNALYPGNKFEKRKSSSLIRVLFAEMTKQAKLFLTFERFNKKGRNYIFNLTQFKAFTEKNLFQNAYKILMDTSFMLDEGEKTQSFGRKKFDTNMYLDYLHKVMGRKEEASLFLRTNVLYFYSSVFQMLNFYVGNTISGLHYNKKIKGYELIKQFLTSFDIELFNKECPADNFGTKEVILLHFYLIKSFLDNNDKQSLLKAMNYYYKLFTNFEKSDRLNYFASLSINLNRRRKLERIYVEKANELFDFALVNNLLLTGKKRRDLIYVYLDILKLKAYLFDAETIEAYAKKYLDKVPKDLVPDTIDYTNAFINFKIGDFNKCLECVSKKAALDEREMATKYKLKICSLFELGYLEEAMYALLSFKRYMEHDRVIGPITRAEHMDFIISATNLFKLRNSERAIPVKIKDTIKFSLFGEWLIEKASKLVKPVEKIIIS